MVNVDVANVFLLAQQAEPKVPEPTRSIALMALLGIALLGLLLIAITMLGASWVRKQGFRRKSVVPSDKFLHRESTPSQRPVNSKSNFSSAETFAGDDTIGNDDTLVS